MNIYTPKSHKLIRLFLLVALVAPLGLGWLAQPRTSRAEVQSGPLLISEILPNALNEATGELIEIINIGTGPIDIEDWLFVDGSGVSQVLKVFAGELPFGQTTTQLEPGQIALVLDKDYAGEYNDQILALDQSDDLAILSVASGNLSLANSADGVTLRNGTDQSTGDSYSWTSDPGSEVSFARTYLEGDLSELKISSHLSLGTIEEVVPVIPPHGLILSELLPNPAQGEEFIELNNTGADPVDLSRIALVDASGKTATLEGTLAPSAFGVFYKSATGISLNNDGDRLELQWHDGSLSEQLDTTEYGDAPAGQSWSLLSGAFTWTETLTPGKPNQLAVTEPETPDEPNPDEQDDDPDIDEDLEQNDEAPLTDLANLDDMEAGTRVRVLATATTPAGLFYSNTAHVTDPSGAGLIKVGPDTPKFAVGDQLALTGEVSTYSKQIRIVVDTLEVDGAQTIEPLHVSLADLKDGHLGRLVQVNGTVSARSSKSFRITDKEDDLLISVRKNTDISSKPPKKGEQVSVTGIVLRSGDNLVVAPRSSADLGEASQKTLTKTGVEATQLILLSLLVAMIGTGGWFAVHPVVYRA